MDTHFSGRKKNNRIAVITNGWSGEFLGFVLESIRKEAAKDSIDLFVFTSYILWHDSEERKRNHLKLFSLIHPEDYDGAIVFTNTFNIREEFECVIELFKDCDIPVITTEIPIPGIPFIGSSNYKGMHDLTTHLIKEHNVKNIIYMSGIEGHIECAERKKAVEEALSEHGLKLMDTIQGDFGFYTALVKVSEWVEAGKTLPDAFVCANDLMALGVISGLHKHGIEVPRDVIVTGFDYIKESKLSYPLVATVSRQWDRMGEYIYDELLHQMTDPDPDYKLVLDSTFIPSESCGCKPDDDAIEARLEKVRNMYPDSIRTDMVDLFFQTVRGEMDRVESKDDFFEAAKKTFGKNEFFGPDYCFCTDPRFFEEDPDEYVKKVLSIGDKMDVIYEKRDGESLPGGIIDSRMIYPGYHKEAGKSGFYIICMLNSMDYLIGYIAIKNSPNELYELSLKRLINNLNQQLITIKNYIFSQQNYRKLREIYMTDFLTGLYNRAGCEKFLFSFINRQKEEGHKSVLLFFDINNMKFINDDYGHLNGDLAIKATAEAMRLSLSGKGGWLLGRYGGDEFVAVGEHEKGMTIEKYRERFGKALKKTVTGLKLAFELSASTGCCIISPDDSGTIEDYIRIADQSMYEEKEKSHRIHESRRQEA
ncbi:MAG: GGDEF domain-containing protein [Lachnospiraceae bacterium]|nr:GGDEF domain-containing protein [Lachnospiraceae bacterium]